MLLLDSKKNQTKEAARLVNMFGRHILSLAALSVGAISIPGVADAQALLTAEGSVDIGDVGIVGSHTGEGANWVVSGSGLDIWGNRDHFHYTHFNATGDVTVTGKMNSFTGSTNHWRKGGIMFRNGLGSQAAHSMIQLTGWGIAHQSRPHENGWSTSKHDSYDTSNVWLRLVKSGNTITSFVKRDGEYGFMEFYSLEVDLGDEFSVGIAVCSHENDQLASLDVSDFEISEGEVFSLAGGRASEVGDTGRDVRIQEYAENMWSMGAGGADIGGTSDNFGFFDREQTGDIVVELHLEKLAKHNIDSKGGLMIRASHDVDAPHVSLLVTARDGVTLLHRSAAGETTASTNVGVMHEDVDLRMEKTGNEVKCMYKANGAAEWFHLGTVTAALDGGAADGTGVGTYYVGQACSSGQHGYQATLKSSDLTVTDVVA